MMTCRPRGKKGSLLAFHWVTFFFGAFCLELRIVWCYFIVGIRVSFERQVAIIVLYDGNYLLPRIPSEILLTEIERE